MAKAPRTKALATLGLNIRKRREALKLTQEKVAERATLDPTYISGIERGVRNPSIISVVKVALALRTTVAELSSRIER